MENINDFMPLSNDWNKERLETLKKLFPDIFTNEGKLNIDELKKVIDPASVNETERYEFRWFGKSQAKRNAFTPSNATLIYDEARSINASESENLIIEGENLEVLKLLSGSYRAKVKCIYIDPPYNTGKDFVYSDNYSEDKKPYWEQTGVTENGLKIDTNNETDGRFHSKWLNMMYSRLLIARAMLKPDGAIFISIDDNEIINLLKLCDEVFGPENFIGKLAVVNNLKGRNDKKNIAQCHEYLLIYGRSEETELSGLPLTEEQKADFKNTDENGNKYALRDLRKRGRPDRREDRPNMFFSIFYNKRTRKLSLEREDENDIEITPKRGDGSDGRWRWGKIKVAANLNILKARYSERNERWDIDHCVFLNQITGGQIEGEEDLDEDEEATERVSKSKSIWMGGELSTDVGRRELKKIMPEIEFDYPKSISHLKRIMQIGNATGEIVMDFFAGSGTSGQAILELNADENFQGKFILIQLPEFFDEAHENYRSGFHRLSDITIERNKRVVEKIIEEKQNQKPNLFTNGDTEDDLKGLGFKVFKLVKSNFPRVEFAPDPEKTDEENIALLKKYISDKEAQLVSAFNREELLTEILLKNNFNLNYKTEKQMQFKKNEILLATDGEKETLICLDVVIDIATVDYFKKNIDKKFICLERALDTTKKYNLKHYMGDKFNAF